MKDLSDQWGVSTQFVQQWGAAAKLSGVETEQLGKSIQFMTEKLSESSPEYDALLRNIGLSGDALRKMSTEDAYKEIIQKIAGIKDETLQLDVAMGILGPNAKKIIGGIRDGMYDAADAQKYMSDETIKRLADAGDAWERFKNNVIIYSGEMLATVQKSSATMTQSWGTFFHTLALGATDAIGATHGAAGAFLQMKSGLDDYADSLKTTGKEIPKVTDADKKNAASMKTTAQVQEDLRKKTDDLKASEQARTKVQQDAKKAQDDWNKRLQADYNAVIDLKAAWSGSDITLKALQYVEALKSAIPIGQMTIAQQESIHKVMEDAIEVYNAAGKEAPQAMYDIWAATVQAAESTETYQEKLDKLAGTIKTGGLFDIGTVGAPDIPLGAAPPAPPVTGYAQFYRSTNELAGAMARLGTITGGTFGEITRGAADVVGGMDAANVAAGHFKDGLKALQTEGGFTQKNLTDTATGAIVVAGAFLQATEHVSTLEGILAGAAMGYSIGGFYGAAIGGALGYARAVNAGEDASAALATSTRQLKLDIIDTMGGYDLFFSMVNTATGEASKQMADFQKAANPDQLKAAMDEINAAFKYQDDAINLLIDTAEKYGFTLAELGPTLQAQQLDKQAEQLYQDFKLLRSGGIELSLITDKMAKSVNEYVQNAIKMGVDVPMAMQPMLQEFVDAGTLLDENGNAITNLEDAGVSFALTMSDGFKALINEVQKLTDVIGRALPQAIKDIPDPEIKGHVSWAVDEVPHSSASSGTAKPMESYQGGTDGFKNFGAGTRVMLHGWEAVVPREESSGAFATVSGTGAGTAVAAAAPTVIINAQGAFFDTPGDLQRLADRVNDALTAKFGLRNAMRAG